MRRFAAVMPITWTRWTCTARIRALKEIHTATHPARLERVGEEEERKVTRLRQHEYIGASRFLIGMPESRGERRAAAKAATVDAATDDDVQ